MLKILPFKSQAHDHRFNIFRFVPQRLNFNIRKSFTINLGGLEHLSGEKGLNLKLNYYKLYFKI